MPDDRKNTCICPNCKDEALPNGLYCENHKDTGCSKTASGDKETLIYHTLDDIGLRGIPDIIGDLLIGDDKKIRRCILVNGVSRVWRWGRSLTI